MGASVATGNNNFRPRALVCGSGLPDLAMAVNFAQSPKKPRRVGRPVDSKRRRELD
jgi:hypothetical protein